MNRMKNCLNQDSQDYRMNRMKFKGCPPYESTTGLALHDLSRGQQQKPSGSRLQPCRDDGNNDKQSMPPV